MATLLVRTSHLRAEVLDLLEAVSDERGAGGGDGANLVCYLQDVANNLGGAERMLLRTSAEPIAA